MEESFDNLLDTVHDDVQDVATYMKMTYIRGHPARERQRAIPPCFVLQIWNMYDLLNGMQQNNNYVEGGHAQFQKVIVTHQASIWKFLEHIEKDQRENSVLIWQLLAGHRNARHPIKKHYITV